jgi:hypothetical protein
MGGCGLLSDLDQFRGSREETVGSARPSIVCKHFVSLWLFSIEVAARTGDVRSHKPTSSAC